MANEAKEKINRGKTGGRNPESWQDIWNKYGVYQFSGTDGTCLDHLRDPVNREERQERYEELEKSMDREILSSYGRMTCYLILAIREYQSDPKDILGEVYTRLKLSNEWNGQYFTPNSISRVMAELVRIPGELPEGEEYVTVNEPTCGSGTMIYGAVWAMQKNGFDYQRKSLFVAQDIDIRCVWMTYIQCCLYRIPVVVIHGNTLTQEDWSYWYSYDGMRVLATK